MPHLSLRLVRICTLTTSLLLAPLLAPLLAHAQDAAPNAAPGAAPQAPETAPAAAPDAAPDGASAAAPVAPSAPLAPAAAPVPPASALDATKDPLFTRATAQYDLALQERVSKAGLIDYAKLKGDKSLAAFVAALPTVDASRFPVFEVKEAPQEDTRDKNLVGGGKGSTASKGAPKMDRSWELSFWINASNAVTLQTLAEAYPISSPDDVKDFATRKFAVAGGRYTLAEMRDKAAKLDRRAPFAMIDGTLGGPKMAPRALRAYGLNDTLESAVSALVNDPRLVVLERIQNRVTVPPFLATADEAWRPRTARRKLDGVRALLSTYTDARANRSYFTTNDYEVLPGTDSRKLNVVPSVYAG